MTDTRRRGLESGHVYTAATRHSRTAEEFWDASRERWRHPWRNGDATCMYEKRRENWEDRPRTSSRDLLTLLSNHQPSCSLVIVCLWWSLAGLLINISHSQQLINPLYTTADIHLYCSPQMKKRKETFSTAITNISIIYVVVLRIFSSSMFLSLVKRK